MLPTFMVLDDIYLNIIVYFGISFVKYYKLLLFIFQCHALQLIQHVVVIEAC